MAKRPALQSARAHGSQSIFRNKDGGDRVQGNITPIGSIRFEHARARLAKLDGRETEETSDGDVIEYLARGEADTIAYIEARRAEEAAAEAAKAAAS